MSERKRIREYGRGLEFTKSKQLICHTKKRFLQRFGIDINKKELKSIVRNIQRGKCKFICKESNRVSLFEILFKNEKYNVVYDKNRKKIVTVLPKTIKEISVNDGEQNGW